MMLGLGDFGSGAMLGWLLAAIIPWLLYFWWCGTPRKIAWGATMFVVAAQKRQMSWRTRDWLLLAVRTLLLVVFALALAEPRWNMAAASRASATPRPTHHLFVLDASYSMSYRQNEVARLTAAKQEIRERVESAAIGDRFSLLVLGDAPCAEVSPASYSPSEFLATVERVEIEWNATTIESALPAMRSMLASSRATGQELDEQIVYLVGDRERTTWHPLTTTRGKELLASLTQRARVIYRDVAPTATPNCYLTDISCRGFPLAVGSNCEIVGQLRSNINDTINKTLSLEVNGRKMAEQTIELSAAESRPIKFDLPIAQPGNLEVRISCDSDNLAADDEAYWTCVIPERSRVLCVRNSPQDGIFLAHALAPLGIDSPVKVTEATESEISDQTLTDFAAVYLLSPSPLQTARQASLRHFVDQGGLLVVFSDDSTSLGKGDDKLPTWFPAEWIDNAKLGNYSLDPLEFQHPLIQVFRDFDQAGFQSTPLWKYARWRSREEDKSRVVARFDSGDVAILASPLGLGNIILFAFPASTSVVDSSTDPPSPWTAWPTWPSFLPMIQETLAYQQNGEAARRNQLVGRTLTGATLDARDEKSLQMRIPTTSVSSPRELTTFMPVEFERTSGGQRWRFSDTTRPGFYELRSEREARVRESFAVNLDPRESELEILPREEFSPELWSPLTPPASSVVSAPSSAEAVPLFRVAILLTLLLLGIETMLAILKGR